MTSFAAWIGIDSRTPTSFYFASDSRFYWNSGRSWDYGRKLFATDSQPSIFGFVGDVTFPSTVLGQIVDSVDKGFVFAPPDTPEVKQTKFAAAVKESFATYPAGERQAFTIAHCLRSGEGMNLDFHLFTLEWHPERGWHEFEYPLPSQSGLVLCLGTGERFIRDAMTMWSASHSGGTTRAVFGAFCDSLRSNRDPATGGAPQLVGLYRKGSGRTFGIVTDEGPHVYGRPASEAVDPNVFEWRNCLFERCDGLTLARMQEAQPQPRPRKGREVI